MVSFTSHKICTESVLLANLLQEARLKRGISLEKAAVHLKINVKYLALIEQGDFVRLPGGLYGKKYLTEYAKFLNIDCANYFDKFELNNRGGLVRGVRLFAERSEKKIRQIIIPRLAKNVLMFIIVGSGFLYLNNRFSQVVSPPQLMIDSPAESLVTDKKIVDVAGFTEPESELTINGKQILTDAKGNFAEEVNLKSGMNTITVTAKKKYGQKCTVVKQILVKDQI